MLLQHAIMLFDGSQGHPRLAPWCVAIVPSYGSTPVGALLLGSGHLLVVRRATIACHHALGWQPGSPPASALVCYRC